MLLRRILICSYNMEKNVPMAKCEMLNNTTLLKKKIIAFAFHHNCHSFALVVNITAHFSDPHWQWEQSHLPSLYLAASIRNLPNFILFSSWNTKPWNLSLHELYYVEIYWVRHWHLHGCSVLCLTVPLGWCFISP